MTLPRPGCRRAGAGSPRTRPGAGRPLHRFSRCREDDRNPDTARQIPDPALRRQRPGRAGSGQKVTSAGCALEWGEECVEREFGEVGDRLACADPQCGHPVLVFVVKYSPGAQYVLACSDPPAVGRPVIGVGIDPVDPQARLVALLLGPGRECREAGRGVAPLAADRDALAAVELAGVVAGVQAPLAHVGPALVELGVLPGQPPVGVVIHGASAGRAVAVEEVFHQDRAVAAAVTADVDEHFAGLAVIAALRAGPADGDLVAEPGAGGHIAEM